MRIPRTRIAEAVAEATLAKGVSKTYAREVAAYLLAEGRVRDLESLLRDVQAGWASQGYVEVLARSARPLPDEARREIAAQVKRLYPSAKEVIVTPLLDATVIGGVQITLSDKQLDLSVEAKLNKFKQLAKAGKE